MKFTDQLKESSAVLNDIQNYISENPELISEFKEIVKKLGGKSQAQQILNEIKIKSARKKITEAQETAEEILRRAGKKIKLVTPTSFGTQIDFAREYEKEEIETLLSGFDIKIRGKSVFIVT